MRTWCLLALCFAVPAWAHEDDELEEASPDAGVVLVVLIFGHLFVNLVAGEGVKAIDFAFVAGKLADPFWVVWDTLLLWLALAARVIRWLLGVPPEQAADASAPVHQGHAS
jgi:hypothetical protein